MVNLNPGVIVQTDLESEDDSYPINTAKIFLFDLLAQDGNRSLVLGTPISFALEGDGRPVKVLHIHDMVTGHPVAVSIDQLFGVFPATAASDYFLQLCRNQAALPELRNEFVAYTATAPDARTLPALQFAKLADLEMLLSKIDWVREQKVDSIPPEQYGVVAACADVLFQEASRHIRPDDHRFQVMLRDVALEMLHLAPTVQQRWLDAEKVGGELRKLRRQLTSAKNQLAAAGLTFVDTEGDETDHA